MICYSKILYLTNVCFFGDNHVNLFRKISNPITSSVAALSVLVLSGVAIADGHSNGKSGTYIGYILCDG